MFYESLFKFILYLIKKTTSDAPLLLDYDKGWKDGIDTLDEIDTGYGFNIDKWDTGVKVLDYCLSWIPIYDEEATINPEVVEVHVNKLYGKYVPSESIDTNSLSDFLLNNVGSYFVNKNVADFSWLEQYDVREGFERYGGKVFFKDNTIDYYEYLGNRYDSDNKGVERIIWASMGFVLMVKLHALSVHLNTSQKGMYYLYQKYDKDHTLAPLLYLITYKALDVNRRIPILVSNHGLVARLFAFTPNSYNTILHSVLKSDCLTREELLGYEGTEWNKQMSQYASIVDDYVNTFDISDEEKLHISNYMISVTAAHNNFGDTLLFTMTVSCQMLPKIYTATPGLISELDQNLLTSLLVSVSGRCPAIVDPCTDNVFKDPIQKNHWKIFREKLISEYNHCGWFDVPTFEISVSF